MKQTITKYLRKVGHRPGDSREQSLRKLNLLVIGLFCALAAPLLGWLSYIAGQSTGAFMPLYFTPLIIIGIIALSVSKSDKFLLHTILAATFFCPVVMQAMAGGLAKGGVVILWAFLSPLLALIFREIVSARIYMSLTVLSILAMGLFSPWFEQWGIFIDKDKKVILLTVNLTAAIIVSYLALQYFVRQVKEDREIIEEQKQKTDSLLLNILPEHVAKELKQHGKTEPSLHENVTILFTDFKDFTQFSELFTPAELIGELAKCFEAFDEIVTRHGLEKIKTIGDAYMCVAGISREGGGAAYCAERSVLAALEMAQYIKDARRASLAKGRAYWDVRIGVHTGDVVAGIVGKKKFVFDIWGDAVNVANRLQTCSEEGRVNISDTTFKLVKDYFSFSPRGKIAVKNKGEIDMYFVNEQIV